MPPVATAEPLPSTYEPIVIGYKRTEGGNYEVTWSIAPGKLVRRTVPVEAFNEATIHTLTEHLRG